MTHNRFRGSSPTHADHSHYVLDASMSAATMDVLKLSSSSSSESTAASGASQHLKNNGEVSGNPSTQSGGQHHASLNGGVLSPTRRAHAMTATDESMRHRAYGEPSPPVISKEEEASDKKLAGLTSSDSSGALLPTVEKAASTALTSSGALGSGDKGPHVANHVVSGFLSCLMYMCCSCLMVLANKWLASTLDVRAHVALLLMQNGVATALVASCKAVGLVTYGEFDMRIAFQWLPVNAFFVIMLLTSFVAMRYLSVPMITVFKQLANLLTVSGEYYFFGKPVSSGVGVAFATMILGAGLAAYNDLAFSLNGYLWQGANCCATSAYVLYLRHATRTIQLNKYGMVFYNNLLSLPLLAFISIAHGEPAALLDAHRRGALDATFFACNAFAGSLGMLLNLASVWCVSATSATTYAVVGALNKIPTTVLGYFLFDAVITRDMAMYISLSLFGGFLYSGDKLRQAKREAGSS